MKEGNYIFLSTTYMCTVKPVPSPPSNSELSFDDTFSKKTLTPALDNEKYMGKVFTSM